MAGDEAAEEEELLSPVINILDLLGRGGRSPRKERLVVWQAPKVGRREEGEAP